MYPFSLASPLKCWESIETRSFGQKPDLKKAKVDGIKIQFFYASIFKKLFKIIMINIRVIPVMVNSSEAPSM